MLDTHTGAPAAGTGPTAMPAPCCRLCGARLHRTLIDFGALPLANRTMAADAITDQPYRLHARICDDCTLVQVDEVAPPETVATPCPRLSSRSASGQVTARRYAEAMCKKLRLGAGSLVIEVGSNDGYLLRHFQTAGTNVLGIERAATAAAAAAGIGIPTELARFDSGTAMEIAVRHGRADLVVANNVLQHAPDLFDFAAGLANILLPNGVLDLQVPHLLSLLRKVRFDAFRHDCYSYLSPRVIEHALRSVGLRVFDAEILPDHGGSIGMHACHTASPFQARPGLKAVRMSEESAERTERHLYDGFTARAAAARDDIREFLLTRQSAGRRVAAYGVATRGSSLLNCCGITTREIACVGDLDPVNHGRLLPGSRIQVVPLEALLADPPDDILVLPWTRAAETAADLMPLRRKGTQLWTAVPRLTRV